MYSDENSLYNYQYDDNNEYSNNNNTNSSKGIIIKIIIIILCIILLIWLFGLLKESKNNNNNVVYDVNVHNNNITSVRLSAEEYFFINNNLPKENNVKTISLQTLINEKLSKTIIDANSKVCDNTKSVVSLNKQNTSYVMRINLSCSTNEKEEVFYYDYDTHKCINCNGKTYMTGEEKENDNNSNNEINTSYSCTEWSNWQVERVNDDSLTERSRVVVRAIKKGQKEEVITYGNWSDYTTTPIVANDSIEVETKTESRSSYGKVMTTEKDITGNRNIKIINKSKEADKVVKYCPNGYSLQGNKCYGKIKSGDLDYKKYATYDVINKGNVEVKTEKDNNGKYILVYKNCRYRDVVPATLEVIEGKTTYTYQKKVNNHVTYYRFRTVTKELKGENDVITDDYYEENNLPLGYEKYPGSERTEYSYKLTTCVK